MRCTTHGRVRCPDAKCSAERKAGDSVRDEGVVTLPDPYEVYVLGTEEQEPSKE